MRFSANASKSKQATSRKKMLDNLDMGNFAPSSRRYPFIHFKPDREVGNDVLAVTGLTKNIGGRNVLNNVSFVICGGDMITDGFNATPAQAAPRLRLVPGPWLASAAGSCRPEYRVRRPVAAGPHPVGCPASRAAN